MLDKRLKENGVVVSDQRASRLDALVSGCNGLARIRWLLPVEALLPTTLGTLESQSDAAVRMNFMRVKNADLKDSVVSMKRVLHVQEVLSKALVEVDQEVPHTKKMWCKEEKARGKTNVPEKSVVSGKHVVFETVVNRNVVSEKDVANEAHMVREATVVFGALRSLVGPTRQRKRNSRRDHEIVRRGIGTLKRANMEAAIINQGVRTEKEK